MNFWLFLTRNSSMGRISTFALMKRRRTDIWTRNTKYQVGGCIKKSKVFNLYHTYFFFNLNFVVRTTKCYITPQGWILFLIFEHIYYLLGAWNKAVLFLPKKITFCFKWKEVVYYITVESLCFRSWFRQVNFKDSIKTTSKTWNLI